ncbi:UNVERIFIED_CONTAM: hypothetical protein RMT77_005563 [Armadillidium vulgare]
MNFYYVWVIFVELFCLLGLCRDSNAGFHTTFRKRNCIGGLCKMFYWRNTFIHPSFSHRRYQDEYVGKVKNYYTKPKSIFTVFVKNFQELFGKSKKRQVRRMSMRRKKSKSSAKLQELTSAWISKNLRQSY